MAACTLVAAAIFFAPRGMTRGADARHRRRSVAYAKPMDRVRSRGQYVAPA